MMEELVKINLDRACRSCLVEEGEMENVFSNEENSESQLKDKIVNCTRIEVHKNDGLPKQICSTCSLKISQAYEFKVQYERSDSKLREYIANLSKNNANSVKKESDNVPASNDIIDFNSLYNSEFNVKTESIDNLALEFDEIPNPESRKPTNSSNVHCDQSLSNNLNCNEKCTQTEDSLSDNRCSIYCCEYCEKRFNSLEGLKLHNSKHENSISSHNCTLCDKVYVRQYHLQRHMKEVHGSQSKCQRFSCKVCKTTLTRLEHLKRHMLIHLKNKPHSCSKCNMGFIRNENYLRHIQTCSGVKDFTCGLCHKGYDREEQLKSHIKTHDNPKNMQCLDALDPETFFENAEMLYSEPDINVLEHLELVKQEPVNDSDDGPDFDNMGYDNTSSPAAPEEHASSGAYEQDEGSGDSDSSDVEFSPYKKKTKRKKKVQTKPKVPGRKRGRPRKHPLPDVDSENTTVADISNEDLENIKIKEEEMDDDIVIKTENDDSVSGHYSCTICNKVLNSQMGLTIHLRKHTGIKLHKCPVCEKTFTRSNHMKRHQLTHSSIKPYKCTVCAKGFNRLDHLNIHMFNHADKKPFECDICNKGFNKRDHFLKHKESRHGDKTSNPKTEFCEICKKGFTTAKYLQVHMRNHLEGKTYTCKFCAITFNAKPDLIEHLKTHSNEKPFLCSECGQRFIRNDYLVIHMRRHKGEKPYKCRYCGKGFPRATDLTVHERYHTGEKTHLCTICGKGFQRAYNLVVHTRVHTGEKPYVCSHCGKAFAQGNDLKAHVRRHTGERYNCEICGEGFIQGYHLTQHKRAAHGIDTPSNIRRVEKLPFPLIPPPPSTGPRKRTRNSQKQNIENSESTMELNESTENILDHSAQQTIENTMAITSSTNNVISNTNVQSIQNNILSDGLLQALAVPHMNDVDMGNRQIPALMPILPLALFPTMHHR